MLSLIQTTLLYFWIGGAALSFPISSQHVVGHDFHTSMAQITYNEKNQSLEVSLMLFIDDFEEALSKSTQNDDLRLDKTNAFEKEIKSYLRRHFYLMDAKKQKAAFSYYGKEIKVDELWCYFEIPIKKSLNNYTLRNNLLTEVFDDQINFVNLKYKGKKHTYIMKKSKVQVAIDVGK